MEEGPWGEGKASPACAKSSIEGGQWSQFCENWNQQDMGGAEVKSSVRMAFAKKSKKKKGKEEALFHFPAFQLLLVLP